MSLFKRGKTWWIDFTTPSGERIRRSAETQDKAQAQELHDKLKADSWRIAKLGEKPKRTWDEAAYKWLMESQHKKSHHEDVSKIGWLQQFFRGKFLDDLTRDVIAKVGGIHGDQAKAGKPIHVTLNATALDMLTKQVGKHPKWVFTYKGQPVTQVTTKAWYKALDRAGIENFRWHDLRHTWASWLTQQGVPLNVIQEMGAWESAEMVRRYAHLAPEQFAQHARVVDDLLNGESMAHQK